MSDPGCICFGMDVGPLAQGEHSDWCSGSHRYRVHRIGEVDPNPERVEAAADLAGMLVAAVERTDYLMTLEGDSRVMTLPAGEQLKVAGPTSSFFVSSRDAVFAVMVVRVRGV